MAIHICITCDVPDCKAAQSVGFDGLAETYGDLVAAAPSIGWRIASDGHSRTARCICPEHAARTSPGPTSSPNTTTPAPDSETAAEPNTTP